MTTTTVEHVTSADGTNIGFERTGSGPAAIMVYGATGTRSYPTWDRAGRRPVIGFHRLQLRPPGPGRQ